MKAKRNFYGTILIIVLSCLLLACRSRKSEGHFEVAIFDKDKIVTFNNEGDDLEVLETITRTINKRFWSESFAEAEHAYVARTLEGDDRKVMLSSIDKESLVETVRPAQANSVYTTVTDGDYVYIACLFTDRIDFYKYNLNMDIVHQLSVPNVETQNASNQFLILNDSLYLLVTNLVIATGEAQVELWQMDKAFNIIDKINLDESSALLRMVNVDDMLYITERYNGFTSNGEPIGSDRIISYHLGTGEKSVLQIGHLYPNNIYYDKYRNSLVIEHSKHLENNFLWTMLNLDTGIETTVDFPEYGNRGYQPPFCVIGDDNYYFLFNDVLVIYVPETGEKREIDLIQYGITQAHAIVIK